MCGESGIRGSAGFVAASVLACGGAFAQNIVQNGDFESGDDPGVVAAVAANGAAISGWRVVGDVRYVGSLWSSNSGERSVHLNSTSGPGAIEQTLPTSPGSTYRVEYALAGHPYGGDAIKRARVSAGPLGGTLVSLTEEAFNVTGCFFVNMSWSRRSCVFTAGSAATVLRFTSLTDGSAGPAIDTVTVSPTTPVCVADFDDGSGTGTPDGGVGIEDLLYYLGVYNSGVVAADVDDGSGTGVRDGGIGIEDLLYYLIRYNNGC